MIILKRNYAESQSMIKDYFKEVKFSQSYNKWLCFIHIVWYWRRKNESIEKQISFSIHLKEYIYDICVLVMFVIYYFINWDFFCLILYPLICSNNRIQLFSKNNRIQLHICHIWSVIISLNFLSFLFHTWQGNEHAV